MVFQQAGAKLDAVDKKGRDVKALAEQLRMSFVLEAAIRGVPMCTTANFFC